MSKFVPMKTPWGRRFELIFAWTFIFFGSLGLAGQLEVFGQQFGPEPHDWWIWPTMALTVTLHCYWITTGILRRKLILATSPDQPVETRTPPR